MNAQVIDAASAADTSSPMDDLLEQEPSELSMSLQDFVSEFGDELLESLNRANCPSIVSRRARTGNWCWPG